MKYQKGFTLVEILLVMGIMAILATVVLVAVNPARQFAQARDTQRTAHVNTILNAIGERIADHVGIFEDGCGVAPIPTSTTPIKSGAGGYNPYACLVPTYVSLLPVDPKTGRFSTSTDYDTGYTILADAVSGRITIAAPATEIASTTISASR